MCLENSNTSSKVEVASGRITGEMNACMFILPIKATFQHSSLYKSALPPPPFPERRQSVTQAGLKLDSSRTAQEAQTLSPGPHCTPWFQGDKRD